MNTPVSAHPASPQGHTISEVGARFRRVEWMVCLFFGALLASVWPLFLLSLDQTHPLEAQVKRVCEWIVLVLLPLALLFLVGALVRARQLNAAMERLFLAEDRRLLHIPLASNLRYAVDKERVARFRLPDLTCIYCARKTDRKRIAGIVCEKQGGDWGLYLGGLIGGGFVGAIVGRSLFPPRIMRAEGVPEGLREILVYYPVCEECRPEPLEHWQLVYWLGMGWFILLLLLSAFIFGVSYRPSILFTLAWWIPGLFSIGVAVGQLFMRWISDGIRLRLAEGTLAVELCGMAG